MTNREFTGRHMLAIMVSFFAVIIAVNVTMTLLAGASWTGLVVRNSYVASQEFNGKVAAAREQKALGWSATLGIDGGVASLVMVDIEGRVVAIERATLELLSPIGNSRDRIVDLVPDGLGFSGVVGVADGRWVVAIRVRTTDGHEWIETRRIRLSDGNM